MPGCALPVCSIDTEYSLFAGWKGLRKIVTPVPRRYEHNRRNTIVGGCKSFCESLLNFRDYDLET